MISTVCRRTYASGVEVGGRFPASVPAPHSASRPSQGGAQGRHRVIRQGDGLQAQLCGRQATAAAIGAWGDRCALLPDPAPAKAWKKEAE